jgi:hypothetical protein
MLDPSSLQSEPAILPDQSFGRTARSVAAHAFMTALMLVPGSPLLVFIPAALFHCGIRNGRRAAWLALAIAVAITSPFFLQPKGTGADFYMAYAYFAAMIFAVAIPALAVLPLVQRGMSFGRVLIAALLVSIGGLALIEVGMRAIYGFSPYAEQMLRASATTAQFIEVYRKANVPADMVRLLEKWMGFSMAVVPAAFVINIALVFILSLVMLGRLSAWRQFVAKRDAKVESFTTYLFRNLALPDWLLFAFVAGGLTPLLTGMLQKIAANILAVVTFLYFIQGLAIFRSLIVSIGAGFVGTMFGYLMLGFLMLTGVAPILLSIAGLFDSFFDFRHYKRKDDSHEGHTD